MPKQCKSFEEKAGSIIKGNNYLVTATSDKKGSVWAATVSYVTDSDYNFYFLSAVDSRHAENISVNPKVAFEVFDSRQQIGSSDGVQAEGTAELVGDKDLPKVIGLYSNKFFPGSKVTPLERYPPENYSGASEFRFFKITISVLYVTGGGTAQGAYEPNNERRVEIDLKRLPK